MTAFAFWKTAHVLSAAIIFGTGLGIAFFTWFGYRNAIRSGDIALCVPSAGSTAWRFSP